MCQICLDNSTHRLLPYSWQNNFSQILRNVSFFVDTLPPTMCQPSWLFATVCVNNNQRSSIVDHKLFTLSVPSVKLCFLYPKTTFNTIHTIICTQLSNKILNTEPHTMYICKFVECLLKQQDVCNEPDIVIIITKKLSDKGLMEQ